MFENIDTSILLALLFGLIIGIILVMILNKIGVTRAKQKAQLLIQSAESESENTLREAILEGKTQAYELKLAAEKEVKERRGELSAYESRLDRREDNLNMRDKQLLSSEKSVEDKTRHLNAKTNQIEKMEQELESKINEQLVQLEKISTLTVEEAKAAVMEKVEHQMESEIYAYIREQEEVAHEQAELKAKEIIGVALDRYSQDEVTERTVSVVHLPNEEMKGRIIGREGRNIRAIEAATGVDLIIDDTPEVITISCFNPIRREIARQAIEILIKDGRIQPGRIEDVVNKVSKELDVTIKKAGEDALFELGIHRMDKELVKQVGTLKYRYSYGQNALQHSIEVGHLAGIMAAELGLNQNLAKRAGLLHDIGKSLDFEVEGSHVELGARFAKKHGENATIINAIESHHGDTDKTSIISYLVSAADTLSAARPGARYESFENYIQRLEQLENIANSFDGIERTFAIQAGREIRVMVVPDKVDDAQSTKLAREIRDRIENEMTYPGQIKVTVIREVRKSEIAK